MSIIPNTKNELTATDTEIAFVHGIKYLGVFVDNELMTFDGNIRGQRGPKTSGNRVIRPQNQITMQF